MTGKNLNRILSFVLLVGMLFGFTQLGNVKAEIITQTDPLAKVEGLVLDELEAESTTDYFIWMTEKADLSPADQMPTQLMKGQFVFDTLVATADRTQADLRAFLHAQRVDYQSFYISNKILVRGGDLSLLMAVAVRSDVAQVTANHQFQLQEPFRRAVGPDAPSAVEPNIIFINADDVWAMGVTGQGTVMAGNDTGLYENHPAIAPHYRGCIDPPACTTYDHNYNWWDATGTYPTNPDDGHGHGTHTTGTMVGDDGGANQIGVAPGAQTVHCKNMTNGGSGDDGTFTECFQWDLAPWDLTGANPDPAMAPDAINNSWGYWGGGANQFRDEIQALHAAGILVEVSSGNEGSSCSSLRSPGDYFEVLTTGSINHTAAFPGSVTGFSSRGPSSLDPSYFFPDIMAPGENIRSSVPGGGYEGGWSGTSMAGPHATALVGLMWSACPSLQGQVSQTLQMIQDSATPIPGYVGSCGGNYVDGPNNDWGFGTIDALAAVQMAVAQCSGVGTLTGNVYDADTMAPLEGAAVLADWEGGFSWQDLTDITGTYTLTVPEGSYTMTASLFAYTPVITTGITVITDTTTVVDFYLEMGPTAIISGYVTELGSGMPLLAEVTVLDTPIAPVMTDPSDGYYEVEVPLDTYTLLVTADLHQSEERVVVVDGDVTENFELAPLPCILLVDDDGNGPDVRTAYTSALDNLGLEYAIWDVSADGDPTESDLMGYQMVLWFTGYPFGSTFTSANEAAVSAYLDAGGNFFLSSQDYLYDFGLTAFGQNYLHIADYDSDISQTIVTGQNVFAGLGPYTLSYPFTNYSDIVIPDAQALLAFDGNVGDAGVSYEGTTFNTVFLGFPLEAVPQAGREAIVDTLVTFFGGCITCDPVIITDLESNSPVYIGETMTFTATVWGAEPITYTWDFGGDGTPGGTGANVTFVYDDFGLYTVTLDVENACPSSATDSLDVEVIGPKFIFLPLIQKGN